MRIIERNDQNISPNEWVIALIKAIQLHLDGRNITLTVRYTSENSAAFPALKLLVYQTLSDLTAEDLHGIRVDQIDDPGDWESDLVLRINYSNYEEPPEPGEHETPKWDLIGRLIDYFYEISLKDFSFHDWNSMDPIMVRWWDHGLRIRIPFESAGREIIFKKACLEEGVNISGFSIIVDLVPYVFWFPDPAYPRHRDGAGYQTITRHNDTHNVWWASGKNLYKQRCAVLVYFTWAGFSPREYLGVNVESKARNAFKTLSRGIANAVSQEDVFKIFEALIIEENEPSADLIGSIEGESRLRGVDIQPGMGRFLYFDETDDASSFEGKGRIVAVRKTRIRNQLQVRNSSILEVQKRYRPDNVVEVEVETDSNEIVRINTINLVDSLLDGKAELENAHAVLRKGPWGRIVTTKVPWHSVLKGEGLCSNWVMQGRIMYNGYLRSNPDASTGNNLDRLPKYEYDRKDPLFRNLYDGTPFFVLTYITPHAGTQRDLYARAWHFPSHEDRELRLLNEWIERDE